MSLLKDLRGQLPGAIVGILAGVFGAMLSRQAIIVLSPNPANVDGTWIGRIDESFWPYLSCVKIKQYEDGRMISASQFYVIEVGTGIYEEIADVTEYVFSWNGNVDELGLSADYKQLFTRSGEGEKGKIRLNRKTKDLFIGEYEIENGRDSGETYPIELSRDTANRCDDDVFFL